MKKAALVAAAVLALAWPPAAGAGVSRTEKSIVRALSQARAEHGLPRLHGRRVLHRSAGSYSRWQLRHDYFGHIARIRMSSSFDLRGEVLRLHFGRGVRAGRTVRMWLKSPPHRAAVLHPGMRVAGVGVATGRFGGRRATIVTAHLGAR